MATSIFDHPYAAVNRDTSNEIPINPINFKDSPRKVVVQENAGASLNILNEIAQNQEFACFEAVKNDLTANGYHIDSDIEMDNTDPLEVKANDKTDNIDKNESSDAGASDTSVNAGTDSAEVLDIFLGIKSVFSNNEQKANDSNDMGDKVEDAENNQSKEVNKKDTQRKKDQDQDSISEISEPVNGNDDVNEQNGKDENNGINEPTDLENTSEDNTNEEEKANSCSEEIESSVNETVDDDDEGTDDADENEESNMDISNEFTSELKSGVGNGIIMAVKKKPGRRKKRKSTLWAKPSPYKIRRLSSGTSKRVSIEMLLTDTSGSQDSSAEKDGDKNMVDMETNTPVSDLASGETSLLGGDEERARRRSRTPGTQEGFVVGDDAITSEIIKMESPLQRVKGSMGKRKSLLFHQGRKASPSQIKLMGPEEMERYKEPFKYGWRREVVHRGVYEEHKSRPCDVYYFPPVGSKIRSMVQINDWLASHDTPLTQDNFTFMRRAIGVEGEMVRNASQGRGRSSHEPAVRKRPEKVYHDDHVHDDNDGQYDQPEIVIERDSDEFLAPLITAANKESTGSSETSPKQMTPKTPGKRGRPPKHKDKEFSNIPNLTELKSENVEMMQPSNEQVIISPSKRQIEHKATARKSTTQKAFRKPIPFSGIENLCSMKCPGMEGIPPMLHCRMCMCLFHNECVNYFGENGEFTCLRCKDLQPPSAGGPAQLATDKDMMKVPSPKPLNHHISLNSNIVRVFPPTSQSPGEMKILSPSSSPLPVSLLKVATPPTSMMSLFKVLPGSAMLPIVTTSPLSYPLYLTQNTAALVTPSASPKTTTLSLVTVSDASFVSKSQNLSEIVKEKMQMDYPEIRPLVKQEPVDSSYDAAEKGSKDDSKNVKASEEALGHLKSILNTRLGSPPGENHGHKRDIKPVISTSQTLPQASSKMVQFMNSLQPSANQNTLNRNKQFTVSQPRMSFGFNQPLQFAPNLQNLIPIGPPIAINRLPIRMPVIGSSFIPASSTSTFTATIQSPQSSQKQSSVIVTSQDDMASTSSGPVVVNAKSVTPMNGQLLTLPPPVVKKLTLNKPLALKINNRQITVPPSGFFQSAEGLKVFLPPNTFPTADENVMDVSISNDSGPSVSKAANENQSGKSQKSAKSDLSRDKTEPKQMATDIEHVKEPQSANKTDIRNNKFYKKCCLIQRLYGYDYMLHIFKYLGIHDLLQASLVCKTWRRVAMLPDLWRTVKFSEVKVLDWQHALKYVSKREVQSISLVGVSHFEEPNRTWHQLVSSLQELSMLRKISFGLVPAAVLQSVAGKLTHLESFCAEMISDFTDQSMWEIPTKLDVGNFKCTAELRELKLCGTGGLSLPSFSFGCGLADLGKLSKLHTLHLTSLKNVNTTDFNFISSLISVKDLALGDCENWSHETYSHLQLLTSLKKLRLENGGEIPDTGLGLALSHLAELESLELHKFTIAYTFDNHVHGLVKLRHFCVYPNNPHYMGEVNTNTLKALQNMKRLKKLEWIIPHTSSSSIILDDDENSEKDMLSEQTQQWIPFQTLQGLQYEEKGKSVAVEYISVQQLKGKLAASLPNTDIQIRSAKPERTLT